MKVLGGRLRGRRLVAPAGFRTRPTSSRARQGLFDLLGSIRGARTLDLFAGSGALGLEALSRDASAAAFVDSSARAVEAIRTNLTALDVAGRAVVVHSRVERARRRLQSLAPFDLVFCDPPWADAADCARRVFDLLGGGLLATGSRVVYEHPSGMVIEPTDRAPVRLFERRKWGDTEVSLFLDVGENR